MEEFPNTFTHYITVAVKGRIFLRIRTSLLLSLQLASLSWVFNSCCFFSTDKCAFQICQTVTLTVDSLFTKKILHLNHGTIIRTWITCKKIPCYIRDSACRWLIVENTKIFQSYVKHFWIFPRERNCKILIGLYQ